MGFTLDTQAARKADARGLEAGKHIATITKAMALVAGTGAKGIEFDIESLDGRTAKFIQIWTHNKDGVALSGYNQIHALMTCLGMREVSDGQIKAAIWDKTQNKAIEQMVNGYPDLMDKPVGILLQEHITEYEGKERKGFLINGWFCPKTERVAVEILDKVPEAKRLTNMVSWLSENPVKDERRKSSIPKPPTRNAYADASGASQPIDDLDDDIPF